MTPSAADAPPRSRTTVATPEKNLSRGGSSPVFCPSAVAHLNAEPSRKAPLRGPRRPRNCNAMGDQTRVRNRTEKKKINGKRKSHGGASASAGVRRIEEDQLCACKSKCCIRSQQRNGGAAGFEGMHVCSRSTCCYARSETVKKHIALHTLVKRSDQITKKKSKTNEQTKKKRKKKTEDTVCGTLNTTQHS